MGSKNCEQKIAYNLPRNDPALEISVIVDRGFWPDYKK